MSAHLLFFDRFNTRDFRHIGLEVLLNTKAECHVRRWAADARPVHPDAHNAIIGHFDQLDITAVILNGRANAIDHDRDALFYWETFCG